MKETARGSWIELIILNPLENERVTRFSLCMHPCMCT